MTVTTKGKLFCDYCHKKAHFKFRFWDKKLEVKLFLCEDHKNILENFCKRVNYTYEIFSIIYLSLPKEKVMFS